MEGHTRSCVFAVRAADPALRAAVERRLQALSVFYAPLGAIRIRTSWSRRDHVMVGMLGWDESGDATASADDRPLVWGGPLPAGLASARDLLTAGDGALRRLSDVTAAAALDTGAERARIVGAPSGPCCLYSAAGAGVEAWATHAVTAAQLAGVRLGLAHDVVPGLLAFGFPGGDRTLVGGVRALDDAVVVDVMARESRERSYWPAAERWSAVPERDAQAHGERALLDGLEARTRDGAVHLALTAGADSRVLAVGLADLGRGFDTFTWGASDWPDVAGARGIATGLGAPHAAVATPWHDDDQMRQAHDRDVRWCDGAFALALADRSWPNGDATTLVGMGGETGRAYYYRAAVGEQATPSEADWLVRSCLGPASRLVGASSSARQMATREARAWVDSAAAAISDVGWRTLDVVYAEQRVRRWGRMQVPAVSGRYVPGLTSVELTRAMSSLPLGERTADGFHRRFISARRPDLVPPLPSDPLPPRERLSRLRRLARSGTARWRGPAIAPDELLAERWARCPQTRAWVTEDVLGRPWVAGVMGRRWVVAARAGFLAGDSRLTEQVTLLAGPAQLETVLSGL